MKIIFNNFLARKNNCKKDVRRNVEVYKQTSEKKVFEQQDIILSKNKELLQGSIINSDEQTAEALKSLCNVGLHGKLATAQLRVKTNKIEQRMTNEERNKVFFFHIVIKKYLLKINKIPILKLIIFFS